MLPGIYQEIASCKCDDFGPHALPDAMVCNDMQNQLAHFI